MNQIDQRTVNAQAPEATSMRRLLGPLHVTGAFWYRAQLLLGHFPPWLLWLPVTVFTPLFFLALVRIRRAVAGNLEPVLGPCGFWRGCLRALRTMWMFAWCSAERYEYYRHPQRFSVKLEIPRSLEVTRGGMIYVTAHMGAWEMASHVGAGHNGARIHLVREEELDQGGQEVVRRLVAEHAGPNLVTHFANDDPRLALMLAEALRQGEIVALQGDRPRTGGHAETVALFGRDLRLPLGPAALARACGVPMVPVFCFRRGRHDYIVRVCEPIVVPPEGDRDAALTTGLVAYARELERAIAEAPHQWFCFGPVWAWREPYYTASTEALLPDQQRTPDRLEIG